MHLVHQNTVTKQLAVLGMFIQTHQHNASEVDSTTDKLLENYFSKASGLSKLNESATIQLKLGAVIQSYLGHFWRYDGSLTTPPCTEGVIWTVFIKPIDLNDDHIQSLRENVLDTNFRVIQPRNGRKVYRNFLHSAFP